MSEETLAEMIAPGRTALVVTDVQVDFCAPDGALGRNGTDLAMVEPAIDRIEALIAAARRAGAAICFLRCVTRPQTDSAALKAWHARRGSSGGGGLCREGERGTAYYRVAPQPGDIEVAKRLYSGFHDTDLDERLRARGIDTLVMTGVTTECCVDATARDGFHHDYHIFVVPDACAAYESWMHEASLDIMAETCALLAPGDAVLDTWTKAPPR